MRLRLVLCALVAALLGALPGTTTASAATFKYDAPTVARVDAQQIEGDAAGRIVLSEAREESASLSVTARVVSTTSRHGFIATKAVDPAGLGAAGESVSSAATGLPKNTTRIPSASGNAEFRIPDHMPNGGRYIAETKNVGYQHLSSQLLDDAAYVTRGGVPGRVDVVIDTRTVVSRPLLRAHLDPGNPINLVTMNLNG